MSEHCVTTLCARHYFDTNFATLGKVAAEILVAVDISFDFSAILSFPIFH